MTLESVLQQLRVDNSFFNAISPYWLESLEVFPDRLPHFLELSYLRTYVPFTDMPSNVLGLLEEMAAIVADDPALRRLAWHAHRQLTCYPEVARLRQWPSLDEYLGNKGGLFYLLIVCSALDQYRSTIRNMKIPESYYRAGCQRIRGFYETYMMFNQRPGMAVRQLPWMRHHLDGRLFRIGRFEYMITTASQYNGIVYRHRTSGETLVITGPQARLFNDRGYILYPDESPASAAFSGATIQSGCLIQGIPCDARGFAVDQPVTLDSNEWECVVSPTDHVAGIHIPPGGNMTPAQCRASLEAAFPFFRQYFPELKIRAAFCASWILNTDFETLLPASNLTRFMQELYLFPTPSSGDDGIYFIFGRDDRDFATYPRDNSVRRAMLQILDQGHRLRSGGMMILEEHLRHYGTQYYRRQSPSWRSASGTALQISAEPVKVEPPRK